MVGTSHDSTVRAILYAFISDQKGTEHVFNTIAIQFGPDTMLAVKVKMNPDLNINEAVAHINALERELKERIPKLK